MKTTQNTFGMVLFLLGTLTVWFATIWVAGTADMIRSLALPPVEHLTNPMLTLLLGLALIGIGKGLQNSLFQPQHPNLQTVLLCTTTLILLIFTGHAIIRQGTWELFLLWIIGWRMHTPLTKFKPG